jgi:hypothetical protein
MSSIVISGDTSGSVTLDAPAIAGSTVLTLPATTGTVALTSEVIGVGQTWQNVTSSRALATTYTNNTGKPIQVAITAGGGSNGNIMTVTCNSLAILAGRTVYASEGGSLPFSFIVPNLGTYSIAQSGSGGSIASWHELR